MRPSTTFPFVIEKLELNDSNYASHANFARSPAFFVDVLTFQVHVPYVCSVSDLI